MKLWALALALVGCSSGGPVAATDVTFRLEGEQAYAAFYAASEHFVSAAGVMPAESEDGSIPVVFIPRPEGNHDCAQTHVRYHEGTGGKPSRFVDARIEVYVPAPPRCFSDISVTLGHEMIHAIRAEHGLNLENLNEGHSDDGLFMAEAHDSRFSASTRDKLCEAVFCPVDEPEL